MRYRFPDTDIEVEFSIKDDELRIELLQSGSLSMTILVDKKDLANAFKRIYFK
jgi:hypothetical protein